MREYNTHELDKNHLPLESIKFSFYHVFNPFKYTKYNAKIQTFQYISISIHAEKAIVTLLHCDIKILKLLIVISIPYYAQRLCFVCVLHVRNAGSCIFI